MPAVRLLGYPIFVAGDDVKCITLLPLSIRVFQLVFVIMLSVFMAKEKIANEYDYESVCGTEPDHDLYARGPVFASIYFGLSFIYLVISAIIESGIWKYSGVGTPTEPGKRKPRMNFLCFVMWIPMSVWRISLCTFGILTVLILDEFCSCGGLTPGDNDTCSRHKAAISSFDALVISHIAELGLSLLLVGCLGFRAIRKRASHRFLTGGNALCIQLICRCSCATVSILTCCLFGGLEASFMSDMSSLSVILSDYLDDGGELDVTFSDITAGLVMLVRLQQERRLQCKEALQENTYVELSKEASATDLENPPPSTTGPEGDSAEKKTVLMSCRRRGNRTLYESVSRSLLAPDDEGDRMVIAEGARYMRLSQAIYTWKMYGIKHTGSCCCLMAGRILRTAGTCSCLKKQERIVKDNIFGWNEAALKRVGGLEDSEIVYAHFGVGVAENPYCVVLDHEWRTVAVVVRGTLSLEDAVADLTLEPKSLVEWGERCGFDGSEGHAHSGIFACAEWVYDDLERHGILKKLLLEETSKYRDYRLVITGHSLGAGCASILALGLRSQFPDLRCLCFCPPGCTLSENLCEQTKDYLTSYVLGGDIVPRLSLQGMEHLRNDVLENIARIKVPKYKAMKRQRYSTKKEIAEINSNVLYKPDEIPSTEFGEQLDSFHRHQDTRKEERDIPLIDLYPPGRIVHFVETGSILRERRSLSSPLGSLSPPLGSRSTTVYTALWAEASDFEEIEITSNFLDHHDGENVLIELESHAKMFGLSPPYCPNVEKA